REDGDVLNGSNLIDLPAHEVDDAIVEGALGRRELHFQGVRAAKRGVGHLPLAGAIEHVAERVQVQEPTLERYDAAPIERTIRLQRGDDVAVVGIVAETPAELAALDFAKLGERLLWPSLADEAGRVIQVLIGPNALLEVGEVDVFGRVDELHQI